MFQQKTVKAMENGGLYLVATPIGNLDDMTFRAVKILEMVDYVLAEDTRVTKKLLQHFGIDKQIVSCHEHNQFERAIEVATDIIAGKSMALVSDAGMPCISDPGSVLVDRLLKEQLPFTIIPGSSAGISAYALSGMGASGQFIFHGFLPTKEQARQQELAQYLAEKKPLIFYESPHRITKTLLAMKAVFPKESRVAVVRELTKLHETISWGILETIDEQTIESLDTWKGEIVVVLEVFQKQQEWTEKALLEELTTRVSTGLRPKEAMKELAMIANISPRTLYKLWEDNK